MNARTALYITVSALVFAACGEAGSPGGDVTIDIPLRDVGPSSDADPPNDDAADLDATAETDGEIPSDAEHDALDADSETSGDVPTDTADTPDDVSNDAGDDTSPPAGDVPVIGGCQLFPTDNMWNTPIDDAEVHPRSDAYIASLGAGTRLHPDFGTEWEGLDIGIPYGVVPADQPLVPVTLLWWDESDLGPRTCAGAGESTACYPVPDDPPREEQSDHHVLLVQQGTCLLYELFDAEPQGPGRWDAKSGAIWDLSLNQERPLDWTSADASGLAVLPGLIRYDEVMIDREVNHAIRFTASSIQSAYIRPASHSDGRGGDDPDRPPMGLRLRLRADFDISGFSPEIQAVLTAMKTYGIVLADTGSNMYISGQHHDDWDPDLLRELRDVTAGDFEAVYTGDAIPYPSD